MAAALPLPSSNNTKSWWPRSSNKESSGSVYRPGPLYTGGIPSIRTRSRPKSASAGKPALMTSVTNPKSTPSNAFTSSSKPSKFNFASVIGFGSKSKKQQPVDIQDPPSQVRTLPIPKTNSHKQFGVTTTSTPTSNPRLSRGVASSTSGTSRASTDGPLTPADETAPGIRGSYPQSLMTLTDVNDPFAVNSPLTDRRSSAHSDKSISRRLMPKGDIKTVKTAARLPVGEGTKRKDSRDRSATMPTRARTATDASEAYLPLRAIEPPWASSNPPDLRPSAPATISQAPIDDRSMTVRGVPSGSTMLRKSKSAKPALPWPDARARAASGQGSLQAHQRNNSSTSLSKEYLLEGSQANTRFSATSSTRTSVSSSIYGSPLANSSSTPGSTSAPPSSVETHFPLLRNKTPSTSTSTTPTISTQFPRSVARPPPTSDLPPTPIQASGSPSSRLHPHPSPTAEQHPLRARSGTGASTSALSFASSLSSLSFNSRPSPQEPPTRGAYDYPSLMSEALPVPGTNDAYERRGSNSGSSSTSETDTKNNRSSNGSVSGHTHTQSMSKATTSDIKPKPPKATLPGSRPLPSPPVPPVPSPVVSPNYKRERALSATSSTLSLTPEPGKMLRKQRSFHNTSLQAPAPPPPPLRHYNSFDPPSHANANGQVRSPPLPPPHDLPPLPPPSTPSSILSKRGSAGASPRRKLFSSHKHDRERERKQEPEGVDTGSPPGSARGGLHQALHHSSSWFDESGPEPPSAPPPLSGRDVAQHIVPPAELLRLGAAWERENENGVRMGKSSWSSRDSDGSRTSYNSSSSRLPLPRSAGHGASPSPSQSSKLPRSASLLSKASSAPSFLRSRTPQSLPFGPSSSPVPTESYTSLSPPPRRQQRTVSRPPTANSPSTISSLPPPPRRTLSNATTPTRSVLIERKPSFLDMSARQSVSLVVPELADRGEPERDSFLELSRGMDSIDTIRESIDSVDSFMQ